ncbi:putative disease resistance RPP13-like protein 1 [Prosopis cineraria]|uniref:putative disease resistance RPP13-like protein 1 n=1 Tax=Prosopis cineraria TaxID=364024 RepID=UPI0024102B6D|nr:putative disease resistance RPP13-like protein 1 [Prosopis cineraria]
MAEVLVGAFLSAAIEALLKRLASRDILDFLRVKRLQDGFLLNKLDLTLNSLNKVMEDAEERQYRDPRVKHWLDELRDAVFQAEDLLLEIATEASRRKLQLELHPTTGKLRNHLTSIVKSFEKKIETRVQKLVGYLDFLENQRTPLKLKDGYSGSLTQGGVNRGVFKRLPESSLINEANIFGRGPDKEKLINILMSPNEGGCGSPVDVIAIASMGGMGKTTLARLVYEDKRITEEFQHKAWVCISEEFDPVQATKAIIKSLDGKIKLEQSDDLDPHQCQLKDKLKDKKFFLVLDDVWNRDHTIWDSFRIPFNCGAPGSKILITTREKHIAKVIMRSRYIHCLEPLQDEYPWKLFANHAFSDQCIDPELESIGRKIVRKCGGLPLAIKTLGSLLGTKPALQYWDAILKSDIWSLPEEESNIIPSLRLSYHYLPSNLKRCFAFCSIFPKDYLIEKDVLIQLWMAEGLLHSTHTSKNFEEVGNEIFNDLQSRSFFEPSEKNGNYFIMHDLLNDLAKSVMGEFCVQLEVGRVQEISTKARYFSYRCKANENLETFEDFKCHQLRSFILLRENFNLKHYIIDIMLPKFIFFGHAKHRHAFELFSGNQIFKDFGIMHGTNDDIISRFSHLKHIRGLCLVGCLSFKTLADDISNLKHLHYLDLSETLIEKLPNSICLLINLQTLRLRDCPCLVEFPSNFHKLINLRHLDLDGCYFIEKMPKHMGKLTRLRTMNHFVVAKKGGTCLKELGSLNHLMGSLTISNMACIKNSMDLRDAGLKEKHLDKLCLNYKCYYHSREAGPHQEDILEGLEPSNNLKEIIVEHYGGTKFPNWLGGSHFLPNLVSLSLTRCANCVNLPPLGQLPSLEKLEITELHGIKVIGEEFYGNGSSNAPFRCLSYLSFKEMREWEEWNICREDESFPALQQLHIQECPKLRKSLPPHLPCLKRLHIYSCGNLETTLPKSSCMEVITLAGCKKIIVKDVLAWRELIRPSGPMAPYELKEISFSDHDFEDGESFPDLLPRTVESLSFSGCRNLISIIYRGLLHAPHLTSLSFEDCPDMSFEGMPEDGFPPSLSHLSIQDCPLLEERCQKETGPDWPKIARIPHVSIRRA